MKFTFTLVLGTLCVTSFLTSLFTKIVKADTFGH